ncbi:MAG: hypothetical protein O2909_02640 [Chloroflexi bacterium]|nr:hypothetical protein [Chloroflexota bacterium]MDA1218321.1 hypothetical protein [Chloroflexota bacterium]
MTTDSTHRIVVLDPSAPPRVLSHDMALRPADIRGKRLGFLWNSKPNGDVLFGRLEQLLREKYEITDVVYRRKPTSSAPATSQVMDELATSVDVAIVGLGD